MSRQKHSCHGDVASGGSLQAACATDGQAVPKDTVDVALGMHEYPSHAGKQKYAIGRLMTSNEQVREGYDIPHLACFDVLPGLGHKHTLEMVRHKL